MYTHPITLQPFYIGMGKNRRMFNHIAEAKRYSGDSPTEKVRILKEILDAGMMPIIKVIDQNVSIHQAKECERLLIQLIGRTDKKTGTLTNKTDGGDGPLNCSDAARKSLSVTLKGSVYVRDTNNNIVKITQEEFKKNAGQYAAITKDTISVKDSFGNHFRVSRDDPRLLDGTVTPVTMGRKGKQTNDYFRNRVAVRTLTGETLTILKSDPRYISGELDHISKNTVCVRDSTGKLRRIPTDDPRFLSGELTTHDKNKVTVRTPAGTNCKRSRDNIRVTSGEYVQIRAKSLLIEKSNCRILIKYDKWDLYRRLGWIEIARYNC